MANWLWNMLSKQISNQLQKSYSYESMIADNDDAYFSTLTRPFEVRKSEEV